MTISPVRRCAIAIASCTLAWVLLRSYVADTLRVRGDEFLRNGQPQAAQSYYRRAIVIDAACKDAIAQYAFAALEIRTASSLADGTHVADAYLTHHPEDLSIRLDRALLLLAAHDVHAVDELLRVGKLLRDARLLRLATIVRRHERSGAHD